VIFVSWYDAWTFRRWDHWCGLGCRLPHQRRWEYAAEADTPWDQNCLWGDELDAATCHPDSSMGRTTPPAAGHANPRGFQNMLGNVWEWTADKYRRVYDRDAAAENSARVLRGGSWFVNSYIVRSAGRKFLRLSLGGCAVLK
jgi:formylglycine-generating enzyme required for sulfatase activity